MADLETDSARELARIRDYVSIYRKNYDVNPSPNVKYELSCEHFGEGWNLLNQLIFTADGSGYWPLIETDPENRKLVLDQIEKEKNEVQKR
ncbi:hypothetical protein HY494_01130 [Candidatus Woesearchaeota archaeon]|nr:hypothetical protein [Candidatus Woesearchaeota archaeon]